MLVLTRKKNEKIVIDENIIITIVDVRGDKVRIGIDAPDHILIHRQEIFEQLQNNSPNVNLELEQKKVV